MILWTIQPYEWYKKLLERGIMHGSREYVNTEYIDFLPGYHWLMDQMERRISHRPFPECYPVWAWYQWLGETRKRPDLRHRGLGNKGEHAVRLTIEKKGNEVLLSDYELWHFPLSFRSYIADNECDGIFFEKMLTQKGLYHTDFPLLPEDIQKDIVKSWDKVLDMDFDDPYSTDPFPKKSIQATFWMLHKDEVVKVEEFIAR